MLIAILIVLSVIVFGGLLAGALRILLKLRHSTRARETARDSIIKPAVTFRWNYVILPLCLLILSLAIAAFFYPRLPPEIATRFNLDGAPDRWLSREMTLGWMLAPQLLFTLAAIGTTWGITRLGFLAPSTKTALVKPERLLLFMGNFIGLPQLVLFFAMLNIFSYNSYRIYIMPLWLSVLITVGLATVTIVVLLAMLISKARQQYTSPPGRTEE